jgi:rRNA maturation endonuclease Nob1
MNQYRYVCPNCNRTFLDDHIEHDKFCWHCGEVMLCITPEFKEIARDRAEDKKSQFP